MFQGPSCKRDALNVSKGALKDVYRMLNTSYIFLQEEVHNDHPLCEERERERERETRRHPPEKDKEGILHGERKRENQGVHHMGSKSCNLEPK